MKTLRQGIAVSAVVASAALLGACSAPQGQQNQAAGEQQQTTKQTCDRIGPAMTSLMESAKKGPAAGQEIIDSFKKLNGDLAAAAKDAGDSELKTGLTSLNGSIDKYLQLIDQLKSAPTEAQKNVQSVVSELGANGSKVGQICKNA
ncbi:hypothetical protein [Psychromicrobium lacuslunae]|uniref:Lipoprotein n=1 Tax=Psychromicrobium lacuslunae TaxID=1618207 RepID=A0A0D4C0M8_9MICC|nr:hypothetical protein [Psychromicrobium lacuslunae]AJT42094.1 hypothetical protein UM93_12315 [Psychromicrobium lacuslunae]